MRSDQSGSLRGLRPGRVITVIIALVSIGLILWLDRWVSLHIESPRLDQKLSYGLLFSAGLLTSFHCVGMCGPLIFGYSARNATAGAMPHSTHLLYGVGKTISYTLIGGAFGLVGGFISFTEEARAVVGIASGLFLTLFGLHMLNVFPSLHHIQIKTPGFISRFIGRNYHKHRNQPFIIGLLNGLMIICGPLQAMYMMAAGSGSAVDGALALFFFGLGTLPMLLGFGFLTGMLSASLTPKLLKGSGLIVIILGAIMLNRGLAIAGSNLTFSSLVARFSDSTTGSSSGYNSKPPSVQTITTDILTDQFSPGTLVVQSGVPVRWIINGKQINECNRSIVAPGFGIKTTLHPGQQIIEFTPHGSGVVPWSCSMGVISGSFIVRDGQRETGQDAPAWYSMLQNAGRRLFAQLGGWWRDLILPDSH